ncbi:hypothetical protein [Bacillus thuringiensis]|nr:hypothetical protein [Bacillus thuringiensis]MDA2251868.1 hypothetical protein [Bacillus cereus]MDA2279839.1 hypothetical protein [Bacillus cereus]MDA2285453.1 hypothetical protein [Bacillus cereus]MDA2296381.1 hypothetical protein [Bacillus cereus]
MPSYSEALSIVLSSVNLAVTIEIRLARNPPIPPITTFMRHNLY